MEPNIHPCRPLPPPPPPSHAHTHAHTHTHTHTHGSPTCAFAAMMVAALMWVPTMVAGQPAGRDRSHAGRRGPGAQAGAGCSCRTVHPHDLTRPPLRPAPLCPPAGGAAAAAAAAGRQRERAVHRRHGRHLAPGGALHLGPLPGFPLKLHPATTGLGRAQAGKRRLLRCAGDAQGCGQRGGDPCSHLDPGHILVPGPANVVLPGALHVRSAPGAAVVLLGRGQPCCPGEQAQGRGPGWQPEMTPTPPLPAAFGILPMHQWHWPQNIPAVMLRIVIGANHPLWSS